MRRSTVIYLLLFVIVFAAAYYFNNRPQTSDSEATAEPTILPVEYIFTSEDGLPTRIKIEAKSGEVVEVALDSENVWGLILPEETAADQGSVEAAATQVTTMRILESAPNLAPEVVGLDDPEYTLSLQFTNGVERNIEIGVLTPTGRGYYVRGENDKVVIVSNSAVDSLLGLLTNPPYAPTETPPPATP